MEVRPAGRRPPATLVRCADCLQIRYHSGPPEGLTCGQGKPVTVDGVRRRIVKCEKFDPRFSSADRIRHLPLRSCSDCRREGRNVVLNFVPKDGPQRGLGCKAGLAHGEAVYCTGFLEKRS